MGLKPYFTYFLNPWLKPGAIDENIFYNTCSTATKNHLKAVLTAGNSLDINLAIATSIE